MSNGTPAENLQRAMDERALLVRALRALEFMSDRFTVSGDEGGPNQSDIAADRMASAVLSDPLAVALLKEADRG